MSNWSDEQSYGAGTGFSYGVPGHEYNEHGTKIPLSNNIDSFQAYELGPWNGYIDSEADAEAQKNARRRTQNRDAQRVFRKRQKAFSEEQSTRIAEQDATITQLSARLAELENAGEVYDEFCGRLRVAQAQNRPLVSVLLPAYTAEDTVVTPGTIRYGLASLPTPA